MFSMFCLTAGRDRDHLAGTGTIGPGQVPDAGVAPPMAAGGVWGVASPPMDDSVLREPSACAMIIVHACTMIIVHACAMIIVHACTMIIVDACTMIIVHACTMIIVHACTKIIVHACTAIIGHA